MDSSGRFRALILRAGKTKTDTMRVVPVAQRLAAVLTENHNGETISSILRHLNTVTPQRPRIEGSGELGNRVTVEKEALRLVGQIYDAAGSPDKWATCLASLPSLFTEPLPTCYTTAVRLSDASEDSRSGSRTAAS